MNSEAMSGFTAGGPARLERSERWANVRLVADQLREHYGSRIRALGVFGSMARETDGPYSDIEFHCVLAGENIETTLEWSAGLWKCLIGVYSEDILIRDAAVIDETWPFVQSGYVDVKVIEDPESIFPRLREIVVEPRPNEFREAVKKLIVGELYETVGKIRNAGELRANASLPMLAVELAKWGACLMGLAHQHLYSSFQTLLVESLQVPGRPEGYDSLCEMVTSGKLDDPRAIVARANHFWAGVEAWSAQNEIGIHTRFDAILREQKT